MKKTFVVKKNMDGYKTAIAHIDALLKESDAVTLDVTKGERKRRSLPANALQAVWVTEIAKHTGESDEYVRRYVKRVLALPILLDVGSEQSAALNWTLNKIGYDLMTPKQQDAVLELMAVTSIMNSRQHTKLRDQMQIYYRDMNIHLVVR